jgi:hypothetical protein
MRYFGPHCPSAIASLELADEPDPNIRRQSELVAEDVSIASLVADGFPEDRIQRVGSQKIGFDLRGHRVRDAASGELDVRWVEVNGRMAGQPVRLTTNDGTRHNSWAKPIGSTSCGGR